MKQFQKKILLNKTFTNKIFSRHDFWESTFRNVKFINCEFNQSIFCDAEFKNVLFDNCKLIKSNFSHTKFYKTKFINSKLRSNNFRDSQRDNLSKIPTEISLFSKAKKQFSFQKINQKSNISLNKIEKKIFHALTKGPGFYVIKNFHSKTKIKKLFKILDKIVSNDKKIKSQSKFFARDKKYNQKWIYRLLNLDKFFINILQPEPAMSVFKSLLGNRFICGFFGANCLLPGARGQIPHLDYPYYRFMKKGEKVPFTSKKNFFLNCQILTPITKFDKSNGSTGFFVNSHKMNKFPKENTHKKKKYVQLNIDIGSIVIYSGLVWHFAKPNYSHNKKRYGVIAQYVPEFVSPMLNLKAVTNRKIVKKNKNLRKILGLDLEFPSIR